MPSSLEEPMLFFQVKMKAPVLVVGLGKSGRAAVRLLRFLGYSENQIKIFDAKPGVGDFSKPEEMLSFDPKLLVVSPGVDLKTPWIQNYLSKGCQLTSELDLACQKLTHEKVIGITGSMGKSTTTSLIEEAAKSFSPTTFAGGNLGTPLAEYVCDVLEQKRTPAEWVILELSSYQLENCEHLQTDISVLTALSPNHLERYPNLESYYATKWTLKDRTRDRFFLNFDNSELEKWCASKVDSKCVGVRHRDPSLQKYRLSEAQLVGTHNQENLALATQVALYLGWPDSALQAIKNYKGLPHRLEFVTEKGGIIFINDSKATTIESVLAAVHSCENLVKPQSTLHLLVGGRDKNLPWEDLSQLNTRSQFQIHYFGEFGQEAFKKAGLPGSVHSTLKSALPLISPKLRSGDVILLSPGGSSLDEFKNFEERGNYFKSWAMNF